MAVRAPTSIAKLVNPKSGLSMVEAEIIAETAASLGHHGRKLEATVTRLREAPEGEADELTRKAARAAWEYFVQRELMGMRDHRLFIREMGIPQEALNRMGAVSSRG